MKKDSLASFLDDVLRRLRRSTLLRFLFVGFLILLLQIPIALISSTVREREMTRAQAMHDVTGVWGGQQTVSGPLLVIPFRERVRDDKGRLVETKRHAFFLPERLEWEGDLATEVRKRGIFSVPLYIAQLRGGGTFAAPDFSEWQIAPADVLWDGAEVVLGLSDPRALREPVSIEIGGRPLPFGPGRGAVDFLPAGIRARVGNAAKSPGAIPFRLSTKFGGSEVVAFHPFGVETRVKLISPWPSPSFNGGYLPEKREVSAKGFEASWRVLNLGRNYPQRWLSDERREDSLGGSTFGVSLFTPVTAYTMTERAVKYQILFLLLTFVVFTLFELFHHLRLHSVQYLLVGSALCVFYLLCLSLAEHIGFDRAYALAAVAVVGLVGGYCVAVLRGGWRAAMVGGMLTGLYAFLYVLLHLEDHGLLAGTLGLFAALATVMWTTRNVDWHRLGEGPVESEAS